MGGNPDYEILHILYFDLKITIMYGWMIVEVRTGRV